MAKKEASRVAKRKKRHSRKKANTNRNLIIALLVFLVAALSLYVGYGIYERHQQQEIQRRAQQNKQVFISEIAPEAQAMDREYHVPASVTIAQAILESNWGTSELSSRYHNLFGIKGTGPNSQSLATKEYVNGRWIVTTGQFKVYDTWNDSIKDHTQLMLNGTSSNHNNYYGVTHASNYKDAAIALQRAGYATDPNYASKLINIIQNYNLAKYDN